MFHENCLLADDSHEISYLIHLKKSGKMSKNLLSAAVMCINSRVQTDYSQLRTCKINCVFLFFTPCFLCLQLMSAMVFLIEYSHREFACIYLFT